MKRVVQVIEAMPRHLNVDIIRLDDALGETWGLPLQGCSTWDVRRLKRVSSGLLLLIK
jgi:hypothetical protein